jgi:arylsulfatase A-like enzyme
MKINSNKSCKAISDIYVNIIILVFGSLGFSCGEKERGSDKPPNIVFILSDDHASAAISSYGSEIIETPHIDRIAQQGVRFTNAFVTSSLCSPARAAILTGMYGSKSGFKRNNDHLDRSLETFPKLLQQGGYETAVFGKWHLGSQPTGFTYFEVVRGQGEFFDPSFYKPGIEWNDDWKSPKINDHGVITPGYFSDIITDHSIEWLENRNSDSPFALFVHHKAPHSPHITPERYDAFFTEDIPKPDTFDDLLEGKNSFLKDGEAPFTKIQNAGPYDVINTNEDYIKVMEGTYVPPVKRGTKAYKEWAFQTMFKGYYRQIVNMDENIGRLLDYLEDKDLVKNTIIVYVSDNGWFLGDFGFFNKMWMYEESLKIPLIMMYSDHFSANSVEESIVSVLDFAPTFLEYARLEIPSFLQGRSLKPLLEGKRPDDWRTSFYYHFYDQYTVPEQIGIRTEEHKLIKVMDANRTEYELYDLKADPQELNNVFGDPMYEQTKNSLIKRLEEESKKFDGEVLK